MTDNESIGSKNSRRGDGAITGYHYYEAENGTSKMISPQKAPISPKLDLIPKSAVISTAPTMDNSNHGQAIHYHLYDCHINHFTKGKLKKRGHLFFGLFCDMRRAVVYANVAFIGIILFMLVFMLLYRELYHNTMYMDYLVPTTSDQSNLVIAVVCFRMFTSIIGIFGAIRYNVCCLVIPTILYSIDMVVVAFVSGQIIGATAFTVIIYPHIFLIHEINEGIMTEENYEHENYCFWQF